MLRHLVITVQDQTVLHEKFKCPGVDLCVTVTILENNYWIASWAGSVIYVLGMLPSVQLQTFSPNISTCRAYVRRYLEEQTIWYFIIFLSVIAQSMSVIRTEEIVDSGVASAISEGDIFIYSCSAQLISFQIESTSKEINCAEHEYLTIIRRRRGDYRGIFTETKSRWIFPDNHRAWGE